jgi:isopropylmalate/homocitrate/citramalate synthase
VARKRDIQQWHEACREASLTEAERFAASKDLHRDKHAQGSSDKTFAELVAWLREWRAHGH